MNTDMRLRRQRKQHSSPGIGDMWVIRHQCRRWAIRYIGWRQDDCCRTGGRQIRSVAGMDEKAELSGCSTIQWRHAGDDRRRVATLQAGAGGNGNLPERGHQAYLDVRRRSTLSVTST